MTDMAAYGAYIDFLWRTYRVGPWVTAQDEAAARTWFAQEYFPHVETVPMVSPGGDGMMLAPAEALRPIWRAQGMAVARTAAEADAQLAAWRTKETPDRRESPVT